MRLPKAVRIGLAEYKVLREKHPRIGDRSVLGWEKLETQELCVSTTVSDLRQVETFLHECLHAILDEAGLHEQAQDHGVIDPLTISLMHFLMENDLTWLNKFFKEQYIERYR